MKLCDLYFVRNGLCQHGLMTDDLWLKFEDILSRADVFVSFDDYKFIETMRRSLEISQNKPRATMVTDKEGYIIDYSRRGIIEEP